MADEKNPEPSDEEYPIVSVKRGRGQPAEFSIQLFEGGNRHHLSIGDMRKLINRISVKCDQQLARDIGLVAQMRRWP